MALALDGVIRRYGWGSTTAIPQLLGLEPDGRPAAELWFGAHPDDPSPVPVPGGTLDEIVAADPLGALGTATVERFGPRLPFLLKVLAAASPLSIQVHPNLEQARAGFAAEDAAGVARSAPERNYRDPNHKPELLCALSPFDALCGFRPVAETLALLEALAVPELGFVVAALRGPDPLRSAFTALLGHDEPAELVEAVAHGSVGRTEAAIHAFRLAARAFPEDLGAVLTLLLNYVRLEPGEAIYLGAGNVHCYLGGTGVEIMADSDNVLRCGLTPKHVDVPELLRITDFAVLDAPRRPRSDGGFAVPVPDFALRPLGAGADVELPAGSARIVLCTVGTVRAGDIELTPGHAAFVRADEGCRVHGPGTAFVAGVGSL